MFFFCKQHVCITKIKEKHFKNNIDTSVGHQKDFLEQLGFFQLIIYLKAGQNHIKHLKDKTINFLGPDISGSNCET